VLISGELDRPDKPIWKIVDKHRHEHESKNTSSISSHYMQREQKVVELVNLCGHLKYLKQTLHGMTGQGADYAVLLVNVNDGLSKGAIDPQHGASNMGIENLNALIHLQITFVIVLTKIDSMKDIGTLEGTLKDIDQVLQSRRRQALRLEANKDLSLKPSYIDHAHLIAHNPKVVPIICSSNRTGLNMDSLRNFLFELPTRPLWKLEDVKQDVFFVTSVYKVKHMGIIVAGDVKSRQPINVGDTWYLGPHTTGKRTRFIPVKIRSIHNNDTRSDYKDVQLYITEKVVVCA
jgi:GTPase